MKEKSFFTFTTQRPVAIIMLALGVAVFGFFSYRMLSWNLMPDISYPTFTVRTEYPGAAPEEVENIVSRPLEEQLSLIKNLLSITSVSRPEQSDIVLEFTWDVNLDRAAQEIREKLDQVQLVREVQRPMILRYDPNLDPILRIGVESEMPLVDLRRIIEEEVARELEATPGVAAARVKGGLEKEILIKVDEKKLIAGQIRFNQIIDRLAQENVNLAGGNIKEGDTQYLVRTLNEFRDPAEIGKIIVVSRGGVPVRLEDLADIEVSSKEQKVITRVNGRESIDIDIYKEADANIVDVCKRVKERLLGSAPGRADSATPAAGPGQGRMRPSHLAARLPENISFHILADQSVFIENAINEVRNNALIGGVLAVMVLFLFLQHFGTTLIVTVAIPLSIIATFAALKLFNVSLNIMSLGGLALGVGMLVDNSIVVIESIFRCREEGDPLVKAASRGVSEVGTAVIASTMTTVAVFFPIVFVEGIAGQIFKDLSLAVVFSLLASLLVALFFIPMLASRSFGGTALEAERRLTFSLQEKKNLKSYLLLPLESVYLALGLVFFLLLYVLCAFFSALLVFFHPVLFFLAAPWERFLHFLQNRFAASRLVWDDFLRPGVFSDFRASIAAPPSRLKKILKFPGLVFRFLVNSFFSLFGRFFMTMLAVFEILARGLAFMLLTPVLPLVNLVSRLFSRMLKSLFKAYERLLTSALRREKEIIAGTVLAFAVSVFIILPRIGGELIPEVHQGTIYLNTVMPVGTTVEKNDAQLQAISARISELEKVAGLSYFAGTTVDEVNAGEMGEHIGRITINIRKGGNMKKSEEETIAAIRAVMDQLADVEFNVSRPVLFSLKPPIELLLKGYNLEQLRRTSAEIFGELSGMPGLKDVQNTIKTGFPELLIEFDRRRLAHYELNSYEVASLVKNKVEGYVATKFKEEDRRVDIRVYLRDDQRRSAADLRSLVINPGGAIPINLDSVARVSVESGPSEIRRINQERTAVISANVDQVSLKEAVARIEQLLAGKRLPADISWELSGQNQEMKTSMNSLFLALMLAVFLVYMVMAMQFESFLHPFLIIFTIPMALIGVILTLYIFDIPLGITVYIGLITLVGIVVNNAIVLISYINLLRQKGLDKIEAITTAAGVRLRPILMTTLTTVLGLLPMALGIGEGAEIRTPMAVAVIAGLLSSTFLTLVLIPIVYQRFSK